MSPSLVRGVHGDFHVHLAVGPTQVFFFFWDGGEGESKDLVWAYLCTKYGILALINGPQIFTPKRICTFDPMVQSIWVCKKKWDQCDSEGSCLCGPFGWVIRWAPLSGSHEIPHVHCALDEFIYMLS